MVLCIITGRKSGIIIDGQEIGYLRNPERRNAEYSLPKTISLEDAAVLFCISMLAVRYDDIDIV